MTLKELQIKHPDLRTNSGDPVFRRSVWSPFFENLHEGKVIYRERFICLARIDDLEITDGGVGGTVVPLVYLYVPHYINKPPGTWHFGGSWRHMWQSENTLGQPYAGWSIWPEPSLIKAVESLISKNDVDGALELIQ
jgi:hypothetical protein